MLVAETVTLPLPVLFAKIASPPVPSIAPFAEIVRLPLPAFSARIPLAEPVTAFAVMVIVVPLATVFLASIP